MNLNQILLIGRAGTDPEMRYTPSGTPVTNFRLAVSNNRRDANGEWTEDTEWFTVTAWERQAESVNQYLSKGRRVFVDGRLSTRQYTSSSGEARTSLEVRAFKVVFLDSPSGESTTATEGVPTEAQSYTSKGSGSQEPDENNLTEDVEELPW
ncbi:MAG: single-stranded DNA-binding protein [Dehalococcoidia bacterium]|nr:single-stranded DNA-binding protein [Chloroflexota bacterium]MCH2530956.1 single-stranded DNA-binding protein [Dehalococcoidia bacterium]MQF64148.1 single-stranded DNA-binding protein [SAR202 cluster bacterium AD-802-L14_MRT_200m]MQF81359.1 single-stranded DNA-binding protein [SAR202 cluster bacterium]